MFKKGHSGNPKGKPKGAKDKIPQELKAMILQALDNAGGIKYLETQAIKNPQAFLTLVGKVLPLQVSGTGEPIVLRVITGVEIDKI
jgi:hypothetical protein